MTDLLTYQCVLLDADEANVWERYYSDDWTPRQEPTTIRLLIADQVVTLRFRHVEESAVFLVSDRGYAFTTAMNGAARVKTVLSRWDETVRKLTDVLAEGCDDAVHDAESV